MLLLILSLAWASELRDVGQSQAGTAALVVVTPGVKASAYRAWIEALEAEGLDAWIWQLPPRGQSLDAAVSSLERAYAELSDEREVVVAAHGYGGVLVLLAGLDTRTALVGTPLAAQIVPPVLGPPPSVVAESLPLSRELTGALPLEPYSAELGLAYRRWTTEFPAYTPPAAPVLLLASGLDPVAPPEIVRLPSQGWPQRHWERTGKLGLYLTEFDHAQLLLEPVIAERVASWLAEGSP